MYRSIALDKVSVSAECAPLCNKQFKMLSDIDVLFKLTNTNLAMVDQCNGNKVMNREIGRFTCQPYLAHLPVPCKAGQS